MKLLKRLSGLAACALLLLAGGCGCPPKAYNVTVTVSDELKNRTIYVDLVGLNKTMGEAVSSKSMSAYWQPGDTLRKSLDLHSMTFLAEDNAPRTLSEDDPIWETWKGATDLYVLARLPGEFDDLPGQSDSRRLILPLGSCRWEGDTIEIVVKQGVVTHTTELLPEPD